eukprot:4017852-Alexandrium_andersonii.AAC.1
MSFHSPCRQWRGLVAGESNHGAPSSARHRPAPVATARDLGARSRSVTVECTTAPVAPVGTASMRGASQRSIRRGH